MIVSRRRDGARLVLAAVVGLSGCSSSNGTAGDRSTPPSGTGASSASGSSASGGAGTGAASGAAVPSGTGTPADSATSGLVIRAYTTFFDPETSAARSAGLLQHGESFADALAAAAKTSEAQGVTARVSAVNLIRADVAYVTFTLSTGGSPLLSDVAGYAVRDGGTWKVAAQTFCNLLQLQGAAPRACKDTSITALPN
jgi:hypothetical protein